MHYGHKKKQKNMPVSNLLHNAYNKLVINIIKSENYYLRHSISIFSDIG